MKKICLFSRVSSEHQDVEQQEKELVAEAIRLGYDEQHHINITYKESAIKNNFEERKGIQELIEKINSDPDIDCLLCWELSRIARRADVIYQIRDFLLAKKIRWIIIKPYMELIDANGNYSQIASLMLGIFTSFTESEMMIKKARLKRGVERAKALGRHAGGTIPFGYKVDKNHIFHIDEEQAKHVKWIFEHYVDGWSMRRIAKELIERGVFKSTYLTCIQNINNIIHNTRYIGRQNGKPRIISDELFEKAQNICRRNILHTDVKETKRICKGLLYDRNNGFVLSVNSKWETYYSKRAKGVSVSFKAIEPLIWDFVKNKWEHLNKQNINDRIKALLSDIIDLNKKMNVAKGKIEEKKGQLDKLEERIILGRISEVVAERLERKLESEINELENKMIIWKEQEHNKQLTYRRIVSRQTGIILPDGTVFYEREEQIDNIDELDLDGRIDVVKRIVEKVILDRPKRNLLNIEIVSRLDGKSTKICFDTFRYKKV